MKANLNQLSFTDIYSNIDEYFQQDKPKLIKLFEQHIDLQNLIHKAFITIIMLILDILEFINYLL